MLPFSDEPVVVQVAGSGTATPALELLAAQFTRSHPHVTFEFGSGTNSGGGVRGVAEGTLDLAVANRPLKPEEEALGVGYHPFARDAMVFAVNEPNPVAAVSSEEIRSLYRGDVTDWGEFGGESLSVILLGRDQDESATKLFFNPIMDGQEPSPAMAVLARSSEMVESLGSTPGSVGFTTLGSLVVADATGVRTLTLDGVTPSPSTVADGSYPWVMTFAVVTGPDGPSSVVSEFVDHVTTPEAAELLAENGYGSAS